MTTMMMVMTMTMLMVMMLTMVMMRMTIVSGMCPTVVFKVVSGRDTAINRVGPERLHQIVAFEQEGKADWGREERGEGGIVDMSARFDIDLRDVSTRQGFLMIPKDYLGLLPIRKDS